MKIWCLLRDQYGHVEPVEKQFGGDAEFYYDAVWNPDEIRANKPDLVLCVNDTNYEIARCLDAARQDGIPTLCLQDGILEWRCQYENPLFAAGGGAPQHQPVLVDKIACLGNQSARQIAFWGNMERVEVTGMPRLDALAALPAPEFNHPRKRILVMTAKKPWFDDVQQELIMRSLRDVKAYLESQSEIEIMWRVTKNLAEMLGVENRLQELGGGELTQLLSSVDAVITTPSTAMLEAMLLQRPVAALDYPNVPRFVPTTWTISASEHIAPIVKELLSPTAVKLAFQNDCLTDSLYCDGPAAPRVAALISKMVEVARESRKAGQPVRFAPYLAGNVPWSPHIALPPLSELYPQQAVFQEDNAQALQVRLARLTKENEKMKQELQAQGLGYWVKSAGRHLAKRLKAAKR
jgi:hypothetical protein